MHLYRNDYTDNYSEGNARLLGENNKKTDKGEEKNSWAV
jgi:hypothetical protein